MDLFWRPSGSGGSVGRRSWMSFSGMPEYAGREARPSLSGGDEVTVKNFAASVHGRLMNRARATKRPFQEVLQYYAMERFLYRLSRSPHDARFVLKGALMLHVWKVPLARATKDIDFLADSTTRWRTLPRLRVQSAPSRSSPTGWCSTPRR